MSDKANETQVTDAIFITGALFASGWRVWVFVGLLVLNAVGRAFVTVIERRR
jgi:hypothetical protein